jgi:hypothetical protein
MPNGFVNKNTTTKDINSKIERIEKTSLPSVFKKDVIQSKNQSKIEKIEAINRHIAHVGYNEKFKK